VDEQLKNILGENSDLYKAFRLYKQNVLTPGPNHELVKAFNNALNDVKEGPGPNNEIVKAANALGGAIGGIGNALGF